MGTKRSYKEPADLIQDLFARMNSHTGKSKDNSGKTLGIAILIALFFLGVSAGIMVLVRDPRLRGILSDLLSPLVDLTVAITLLFAARATLPRSRRMGLGWGIFGVALLLYALGDISWFVLEIFLKVPPFPSIADGFYLAFYPASLAGGFLLFEKPGSFREWITRNIDSSIVMLGAILLIWNFLLGPTIIANAGGSHLVLSILFAYPVGDLVLFWALLLLLYNAPGDQPKLPILLLSAGMLITIISDSIFSYQSLLGTYVSGSWLDSGWIISSLLFGLAGVNQLIASRQNTPKNTFPVTKECRDKWHFAMTHLPYAWLIGAFLLMVFGGLGLIPLPMGLLPVSVIVGLIIALVITRQIIALAENSRLNLQLKISLERIGSQSADLERKNLELQQDISRRKAAEQALRTSEAQLSEALNVSGMAHWEYDILEDRFTFNNRFYALFHTTAEKEGGYSMTAAHYSERFLFPEDASLVGEEIRKSLQTSDPNYRAQIDHRILRGDGETGYLSVRVRVEKDSAGRTIKAHGVNQDITERVEMESARQKSQALFRSLFELSPDAIMLIDPHDPSGIWPIIDCNRAACSVSGYTSEELIGRSIDMLNAAPFDPAGKENYLADLHGKGVLRFVTYHRHKDGTIFPAEVSTTLINVDGRELLVGIDHDITERKRAEEEIRKRLAELEAVNQMAAVLRQPQTVEEMLPLILDTIIEMMHASGGAIWLFDPIQNEVSLSVHRGLKITSPMLPSEKIGEGLDGSVFISGQPCLVDDFRLDEQLRQDLRRCIPPEMGGAVIPIRAGHYVIGTCDILIPSARQFSSDEIHLLTILNEIAGNAIQRTTFHQQTERRLNQLTALRNIDLAISSSFDLQLSLGLLLEQVRSQLEVDAADVILFDPALHRLEFAVSRGFRSHSFDQTPIWIGAGFTGQVILKRELVQVADLSGNHSDVRIEKHNTSEQFVCYYGVPLIAKGQVKGVLEIFHRTAFKPDKEWLDFFNSLAGQAAIAVDSVLQWNSLQRSNAELTKAYDENIEGWSRALDLRDRETEGHTQRVTEMTVSLAAEAGLNESELIQIRRGALLHDIGKMGVPDKILLKPGPLTDEEWVLMKRHPVLAYEMISPIGYLHGALDIPYCHHEKWDGTGYPRGLKGEQIPLSARIFAIVDVWDALTSDRPYRPAWPQEKALDFIQSNSGTHFDPGVVRAFLSSKFFRNREIS